MIKKLGLALVGLVVVLLGVIASRPSAFTISRQLQMNAPPEVVFAHVNDFRQWADWSPWEKMDPSMKKTYSGPASGVGAKYEWAGNDQVGTGSMTIADAKPNEQLGITLEFITPFKATNRTEISFAPAAGGTNVTWLMKGENGFMAKAFSLVMDMDKMVGADFEKGLGSLKSIAEADAQKAAAARAEAEKAAEAAKAAEAGAAGGAAPAAPSTP